MRSHLVLLALSCLAAAAACASDPEPARPPDGTAGFPGGNGGGGGRDEHCDVDNDGHRASLCGGMDCDDGDAAVFPGATEVCDGRDSNCDGTPDEGCDCTSGDMRSCWTASEALRGVGACRDGVQRCLPEGTWGGCEGQVEPVEEGPACDGVDQDCDGTADVETCEACPGKGPEVCGNGLDDDCEGGIDDADYCTLDCSAVNPRDPGAGALECCSDGPPSAYSSTCIDWSGLPACGSDERACLDLDGDPGTQCIKACEGSTCVCGRAQGGGKVVGVPDCGFLTPCARIDCDGRTDQPCYSGPPGTLGVGVCHGGKHSCVEEGGARRWGECDGEQLPGTEVCGNDLDDDCDGLTDENDGATGKACPVRPDCEMSAPELCGNGLDDDCDGIPDEGCAAPAGGQQSCWTGALLQRGVGACTDGTQVEVGGFWGPCVGEVLPGGEACGDGIDADCNGLGSAGTEEDAFCCVASTETCNGADDDCDGLADEGVLTRCGTCGGTCFSWVMDDASCGQEGRTCTNVTPSELDPSSITLSPGPSTGIADKVFVTDRDSTTFDTDLIVIDARSGVALPPVDLGYTALDVVAAPDGTVWISSWFGGVGLEHRDATGKVLCSSDLDVSSFGLDASGDPWVVTSEIVGSAFVYMVHHVSSKETVPGDGGAVNCKIIDLTPSDPETTGLVVSGSSVPVEDANHYLWMLGGFGGSLQRLDLIRPAQVETMDIPLTASATSNVAMGTDGGLYISGPLRRLDTGGPFDGTLKALFSLPDGTNINGFALAADGTIWGYRAPFGGQAAIVHLDARSGEEIGKHDVAGSSFATDLAMDGYGNLWFSTTSGQSGSVRRLNPSTGEIEPILSGTWSLTVHHASTSTALLDTSRRRGLFTQVVDAGGFNVRWGELSWSSYAPPGTRVAATMRFADTPEELETTALLCGPYETSPVDLSMCGSGRRYARVELSVSGYGQPSVGDVQLTWDRR